MTQGSLSVATSSSANQEISKIFWNFSLGGTEPRSQQPARCFKMNLVHALPVSFFNIHFNIHLPIGLPNSLFPTWISIKALYSFPFSAARATRPAHVILLDIISLIVICEEQKAWRSSLCQFLHSLLTFSNPRPTYLRHTLGLRSEYRRP